jgi:hypothetical protein
MRKLTKINAIKSLVPDAQVVVDDGEVRWIEPDVAPVTDEQIQAELDRLIGEQHKVKVVSMRQARLALLQANLLDTVTAAIGQGGEADQITWEYATEVRREDALVQNLSQALNLSSQQLDDLFALASTL